MIINDSMCVMHEAMTRGDNLPSDMGDNLPDMAIFPESEFQKQFVLVHI